MKRSNAILAIALFALALFACTERATSPVEIRRPASIAFEPHFNYLGSNSFAPINRIRLTARSATTDAVLVVDTVDVDPSDTQWALSLDVPADAGTVVVLIELINVVGLVETIEWSGLTEPIRVEAGQNAQTQPVNLFQGPPGNLGVTSVVITPNGATVEEGATVQLSPTIASSTTGSVAVWSSLDTLVATVSSTGLVTTRRNGSARIIAVAGPRADTVTIIATQRAAAILLTPDTQRVTSIGNEATFVARVLDPRGAEIIGAGITWSVANGAIAEHLGNGRFRARANGTTTISAASASSPTVRRDGVFIVAQRATNVVVSPTTILLTAIGAQQAFGAAVTDANGNAIAASVAWRSTNAQVFTVNAAGLATATGVGSAEVRAVVGAGTPDSIVATASVIVSQSVGAVSVTPASLLFNALGDTLRLTAQARDGNGNIIPGASFAWSSSNPLVATVDSMGTVRAVGNGDATLTATAGAVVGSATVHVGQQITRMSVAPPQDSVEVADTTTFTATAYDANSNTVAGVVFTWTSSDTAIASVTADGRAQGRRAGNATITAATGTLSGSASLRVYSTAPALVVLTPDSLHFTALRDTTQVSAQVYDAHENPLDHSVTWSSANEAVATVDANGRVAAIGNGATYVRATAGDASDSVRVVVQQVVSSLVVTPDSASTMPGGSVQFAAQAFDTHGFPVTGAVVTWASSDTLVATVDAAGRATAHRTGLVLITASANGVSAGATLNVSAPNLMVARIATVPADTLVEGDSAQVVMVIRNAGNGAAGASSGQLSVLDAATGATLLDTIMPVPPMAAGDSIVVGLMLSIHASVTWPDSVALRVDLDIGHVIVESNEDDNAGVSSARYIRLTTAHSIAVSPDSLSFNALQDSAQLSAVVHDARGHELTGAVTWSSTNPSVASVDNTGRVVSLANGTTWIRAQTGTVTDSIPVVVQQVAASLTVAPDSATLAITETVQLSASAHDANGHAVTGDVQWLSSDTAVAAVSSTGLVTARRTGSTLISATVGDISGTAVVVVTAPNLTVASLSTLPPDTLRDGDSVHVGIVVANRGSATAGASHARLSLVDAQSRTMIYDTIVVVPALAAGDSVGFDKAFLFALQVPIDSLVAVVTVDAVSEVTESDEGDNTLETGTRYVRFGVAGFVFEPDSVFFYALGDTASVQVATLDRFGRPLPGRLPTFLSRDESVVTIDANGRMTAAGEGMAFVVISAEAAVDSVAVHVTQQVTSIIIAADTIYLNAIGDTSGVAVALYDVHNNPVEKQPYWATRNGAVAAVDTLGRVVAVGTGETFIHAHRDLGADSVLVIVRQVVASFDVTPDSTTLFIGDSLKLVVTAADSNGVSAPAGSVTWSSSDTSVVRVDSATGEIFANTLGTAWVRATVDHAADSVFVQVIGPDGVTRIWRGISSNWNDAANWSPAGVPLASDTVLLRGGVAFAPALSAPALVGGLIIESSSSLNLGTFVISVGGNLQADGPIVATTGVLQMTGAARWARATALPSTTVTGSVRAASSFAINGNLSVSGELDMGSDTVVVMGTASTTASSGSFKMVDDAALLRVHGPMTFAGGSSLGRLTAGSMELLSGMTQNQPCGYSISPQFASSGTFALKLRGTTPQTMAFGCPSQSRVQNLVVDNPAGVTLNTDIVVDGTLTLLQGTLAGSTSAIVATIGLGIGGIAAGAGYQVPNTVFASDALSVLPDSITSNVYVRGSVQLPGNFQVNGSVLVQNSANLDVGPYTLRVSGNFSTEDANTYLTMAHASSVVDVAGNVAFRGGTLAGRLTNGRFRFTGDFLQNQPCGYSISPQYAASGEHRTELYGTNQLVVFSCPSASHFNDLFIQAGTTATFSTNASVARNAIIDGTVTGSHTLTVAGNLDASGSALLSTAGLTIAGTLTAPLATYNIGITTFSGTNQTITPALNYSSLYVTGTAALSGTTGVNGSVQISGALRVGAHTLTVSDSLRTTNSTGTLIMQHDSGVVAVARGVRWMGGSTSGLLTAGVLRVGGDFFQNQPCGYSISPQYHATGSHTTVFDGGAAGQTVHMSCPSSSLFREIRFANSTPAGVTLNTDIIVTGGVIVEAGTVTGGSGTIRATIGNGLTDLPAMNWRVPNTTFSGSLLTLPDSMTTAVTFSGTTALPHDLKLIGNLDIRNGADVVIGPFKLDVTGNFSTLDNSYFTMTDPGSRVVIGGNLGLFGGSLDGRLTAGELRLVGNFFQNQPCGYSISPQYRASGSHRTVFAGAAQTVAFSCPTASQFMNLETLSGSTMTLNTAATVAGSALINGTLNGAHQLTVAGNVTAPSGATLAMAGLSIGGVVNAAAATYNVGLTTFTGASQTIAPALNYKSVTVLGSAALSGTTVFDGNVEIAGSLTVGPHTLTVTDSLKTINSTGVLIMQDTGTVDVGRNVSMLGGSLNGLLTAGTLRIGGNFHQNQPCGYSISPQYAATGTHRTVFDGATQTVNFACPTNSQFRDLEIATGATVTLNSHARATGNVIVNGTLTGPFTITVGGNLSAPTGASVSMSGLSIAGTVAADAATYDVGLTTFTGTNQPILPALNYKSVTVMGSALLTGPTMVDGNVEIVGSLTVGPHTLTVTDSLKTINSTGVLIMQDTGTVDVGRNVSMLGGSVNGLLTAGTLRIGGNFHQNQPCGYSISPQYAATGTHRTVFDGATQTVNFACPTNSQFRDLEIATGATVTLNSHARATGNVIVNGTLTGPFTITVGGNLSAPTGASVSMSGLSIAGTVAADAATYDVGLTTFTGTNQLILPALNYKRGRVNGSALLAGTTRFDGSLQIAGSLNVGGYALSVTDTLWTVDNTGTLIMQHADGVVDVGASLMLYGGSTNGLLSAGTLRFAGNFYQNQPCGYAISPQFAATGTHTTELTGITQQIQFNCPTSSQFATLASHGVRTISGNSLRAGSVNIDSLTLDNTLLTISGGTVVRFDDVTFQNFAPSATQLIINAPAQDPTLNGLTFLTAPTTGWYLVTSGGAFTVYMNRTQPAQHGGRVSGTATISGWNP